MAHKTKDNNEKRSAGRILSNCLYIIKQVWKYSPAYIFVTALQCIIWGLFDALKVWYIKELFDRLEESRSFGEILVPLIIFICAIPLYYIFYYWFWQVHTQKQRIKLSVGMQQRLFDQAKRMDLSSYDDPGFYDDFILSMKDSDNRFANLISDLGQLFARIVSSAALIGILFSIDPILSVVAVAVAVIRVVFVRKLIKTKYEYNVEMNKYDRKTEYFDRVFRLEEYAKEVRSGKVSDALLEDYDRNAEEKTDAAVRFGKRFIAVEVLSMAVQRAYRIFAYIYLIHGIVIRETVTLGGFAAALNSTWQLSMFLNQIIDSMMKFPEHSMYVEKYRRFLSHEPKVKSGTVKLDRFESLELRNVTFAYGETPVLRNVNFKVNRGERIAIVGYNGAGKSTLVKLILRLYDPDSGEILINGRPAADYDTMSLRDEMGAVFQDYRIFAATLGENTESGVLTEDRRDNARDALYMAGFEAKLRTLSAGLDTSLTREFHEDGTNLSGGESQKVAISRVFARDLGFAVMDEPSSALDPVAEGFLTDSTDKYAEGRTVMFISHRLSSAKGSDRIYMFEQGELIEQGTHDELMELHGKYAEMFELQAEKYEDHTEEQLPGHNV